MTEKELNQLHWKNKELEVLKNQKDELEAKSYVKGQEITGMPFGTGITNKTCDRAVAMAEINELYEIKLKELYIVRLRIERYIDTIEDDRTRLIMRLRCINNMDWDEIGKEVGYHRTRVSQIYHNHFKKNKDSHNSHDTCDIVNS